MSEKVREWFLYESVSDDEDTLTAVPRGNDPYDQYANMITVVEKHEYNKAIAERDEYREKAVRLTEALDAIIGQYYSERWDVSELTIMDAQEILETHGVKETGK